MEKALSPSIAPNSYIAGMIKRAQEIKPVIEQPLYLEPQLKGMSLVKEEKKYDQNYVIHRIDLPDVEIDKQTRDYILLQYTNGKKFIQVDEFTIMLNSIASIDPLPKRNKPVDGEYVDDVFVPNKD